VVVTTPQQVSLADSRRAVAMYKKLNIPTLGVIENMSYFVCPHCGDRTDIFGEGGGKLAADTLDVPLFGQIPLMPALREGGDAGTPLVLSDPQAPASIAMSEAADQMMKLVKTKIGRPLDLTVKPGAGAAAAGNGGGHGGHGGHGGAGGHEGHDHSGHDHGDHAGHQH
jgi:ATP-binding protein involved in chromosome partitioning